MDKRLRRRSFLTATGAAAAAVAVGDLAVASPAAAEGASEYVDVQLLNITDFHGYLQPPSAGSGGVITGAEGVKITVGGAAFMATHLKHLREGQKNSIFFSSGDNFHGWPFEVDAHANEPTIEVLNALGLDFSTVGNHELDKTLSFMVDHIEDGEPYQVAGRDDSFIDSTGKRFAGADFRFYSGNMVWKSNSKPVVQPYNIEWVDAGGGRKLPVGFIHLTVEDAATGSTSYQPRMKVLDDIATANRYAAELKRRGVHAIIVNIHDGGVAGNDYNAGTNPSGPIFELAAKASPDIAAIVTGHWHCRFNMMLPDPAGVLRPVVEAGNHGQVINEINLKLDRSTGKVIRELTRSTNHAVTRDVPLDAEVQYIADYWSAQGKRRYRQPLARITADVTRVQDANGESTMGNLAADHLLWSARQNSESGAELAIVATKPAKGSVAIAGDLLVNKGSDEADTNGTVLFGEAWNAFGYGNPVLTVSLTGAQLLAAMEQQWQTQEDGTVKFAPFAVSENVRYVFDTSKPVGSRVDASKVLISGKALSASRTYRVAALAYTLIGADGYAALTSFTNPVRGERDREGFIAYLRVHNVVTPPALGRATPAT